MRQRRKSNFKKHLVHFIAHCQDCEWLSEDYNKGPQEASKHAAKTGHEIVGEYGYSFEYKRQEEDGKCTS